MDGKEELYEAMYYEPLDDKRVRCTLCPRYCIIPPGRRGFCRCRENIDGKLYAINYGKVCSAAVDPIEKSHCITFIQVL